MLGSELKGVKMVSKELIAASTKPLVLAVLSRGESYGYAIIQKIREQSGGQLEWSEGCSIPFCTVWRRKS